MLSGLLMHARSRDPRSEPAIMCTGRRRPALVYCELYPSGPDRTYAAGFYRWCWEREARLPHGGLRGRRLSFAESVSRGPELPMYVSAYRRRSHSRLTLQTELRNSRLGAEDN